MWSQRPDGGIQSEQQKVKELRVKIAYRTPSSNPEVALQGSQKGKGEGDRNFEEIMVVSSTNLGKERHPDPGSSRF